MRKNTYKMRAEVWLYPGPTPWHFITLPKKQSDEMKKRFAAIKRGWGALPVTATIGKTSWQTSVFPDKRSGTYLMPLKAQVRKKEEILEGDTVAFTIEMRNCRQLQACGES